MTIEDLQYIFQPQIEMHPDDHALMYILQEGDFRFVKSHPVNELNELVTMLDCFHYAGSIDSVPRFVK